MFGILLISRHPLPCGIVILIAGLAHAVRSRRTTDPQKWLVPTVVALLAAALMIYGLYHASFDPLAT